MSENVQTRTHGKPELEKLGGPLDGPPPEPPPGGPLDHTADTQDVRGALRVEKLEGRQESGRDDQDEAEEDEGE